MCFNYIFKTRILVKDIASENLVFRDTVQDLFAIAKKSKKKQGHIGFFCSEKYFPIVCS